MCKWFGKECMRWFSSKKELEVMMAYLTHRYWIRFAIDDFPNWINNWEKVKNMDMVSILKIDKDYFWKVFDSYKAKWKLDELVRVIERLVKHCESMFGKKLVIEWIEREEHMELFEKLSHLWDTIMLQWYFLHKPN